MSHETPVTSRDKKRELTSPEDNAETKRQQLDESNPSHSPHSDTDSDKEPYIDLCRSSAPALLQPLDLEKIVSSLNDSVLLKVDDSVGKHLDAKLDPKLDACVSKIVDGVLAGLERRITKLESENKTLRQQNIDLQERVSKLEAAADASEQYSRRNCLRISGIPENPDGEQTDDHVMRICDALKVPVTINDVDRSHRVGRKMPSSSKPRQIIVKFATYRARQTLYRARTKLKEAGHSGVFINEDLTRKRSFLLFEARKLAKSGKIDSAWTSDGTVLVKDKNKKVLRIDSEQDLSDFA